MGRHLERNDSGIGYQDYLPGCMSGILHILDYHHWHSVKKMPLRRIHGRGKYATCCRNPKTVSFNHYNDGVQESSDAEAVPLLVDTETTKTGPGNRISSKAHIKALIAKDMSARVQMQRTDSIHHLDADWTNPIIILHKSADAAASRLQVPSLPKSSEELAAHDCKNRPFDTLNARDHSEKNQCSAKYLNGEVSCPQFRVPPDVLEVCKVNKKLFLEIFQDPDVQAAKKFHVNHPSNAKVRLKKSGSFPAADTSRIRFSKPSTLEHKQKEIWSFPKIDKLPTDVQAAKSVASPSLEDSYEKSITLKADNTGGPAISQETSFSSLASSHGLNKHGWHLSFMGHLKVIKKKIKHVIKESRKASSQTSINAVQPRVPSGCNLSTDEKEMSERLKEITIHQASIESPRNSHETNGDNDVSKGGFSNIRTASSVNESVDRYAQLIENSYSRQAKWHQYHSKSLRLSNEEKFPSSGYKLKSFTRIFSLPDLESFVPFPNEASHDNDASVETDSHNDLKSGSIPVDRKQFKQRDAGEESEIQNTVERGNSSENNEYLGGVGIGIDEGIAKTNELYQDLVAPEKVEHNSHQDEEIGSTINFSKEQEEQSPVSVLGTQFQDDLTGLKELPVSEGSELDCRHICTDGPDSFVDSQDGFSRDSLSGFCSSTYCENVENTNTSADNHFYHFESKRLDDADFNYVRDVLELSGFIEPEYLGTWYSLDQPISPMLFKELETYLHHELEHSSEDISSSYDHHQLLFDLINEKLLEIYESALAYFPKPLSFSQHTRPLPKGNRVLEEVWKRISMYRSSISELDQSLDDIIARDLAKDDGWLNLQLDVEDVALDLEDMIFDQLLEEVFMLMRC